MRFLLPLVAIIFHYHAFAQEFKKTDKYRIIEPSFEVDESYYQTPYNERNPIPIQLTLSSDTTSSLWEYNILELETYGGASIYLLENPGISNIKEVVKVEFEYVACCSSIEEHYFLFSNENKLIKLPSTDYVHCDGPEPFFEYRFPNQYLGLKDQILRTESFPNQDYKVDSISKLLAYNIDGTGIIDSTVFVENEVIPQGNFEYELYFSEWGGRMENGSCEVLIEGTAITVRKRKNSTLTGEDVLVKGSIMKHKSGRFIIGKSKEDRNANEIGGCTGGPVPIDLKKKVIEWC